MFPWKRLVPVLLLTGCAALPVRPPDEVARLWAQRQQALAPLADWDLRGRIALRSRDEGAQASLHWVRRDDNHRFTLVGPLGSGQVRLTQDPDGAELRDAEKNVRRARDARALLHQVAGWDVPFEDLGWWVRGLPAPGAVTERTLDNDGRLRRLSQSGWEIEFLEYAAYGAYELPSKLFVYRRGHVPGEGFDHTALELRVVIEHWTLRNG
jgi:outer membrane lipoprotein LolB